MKKFSALLAAVSVAGVQSLPAEDVSVSATVAWESAYVFRGVQLAEEYFSAAVDLSYGGAYFGIWTALPFDRGASSAVNEVDFYLGYGLSAGDLVDIDVGATYYSYEGEKLFASGGNSFEAYIGASFNLPLSPSVYVFHDFDYKATTVEGSIGYTVEVSEKVGLDVGGSFGYVSTEQGSNYIYYGASFGTTYSFSDSASVSLALNWVGADEDSLGKNADKNNKLFYGISFTAGF
jgi:uncharacterized protein (TIGR02001 family)